MVRNHDENGTLAAVTTILSQLRINVANMSLCRSRRGGNALTVIETDEKVPPALRESLRAIPGVVSLTYYEREED